MLYVLEFAGKTPWLTSRRQLRTIDGWSSKLGWMPTAPHYSNALRPKPLFQALRTPSPLQREHPLGGRKVVRVPWMEELQRDTLTGSEKTSMHPLVVLSLLLRIIIII